MTLNQIVQQLQEIANNHLQVNTWGFGDIWEIAASGDIQYPLNWVTLEGVDVRVIDVQCHMWVMYHRVQSVLLLQSMIQMVISLQLLQQEEVIQQQQEAVEEHIRSM